MSEAPLHPRRMPFGEGELLAAYTKWVGAEVAPHFVATVRQMLAHDEERMQGFAAEGHPLPPDDAFETGRLQLEEEILAYLRTGSPDAAARVDRIREAWFRTMRESAIHFERRDEAVRRGLLPSREDVLEAQVEALERGAYGRGSDRERSAVRGLVMSLPELPEATPAMVAAAEASVAGRRAEWAELCAQAERGEVPRQTGGWIDDPWATAPLPKGAPLDWARVDALLSLRDRDANGELSEEERRVGPYEREVRELPVVMALLVRGLDEAPREALPRLVMQACGAQCMGDLPLRRKAGHAARRAWAALGLPEPPRAKQRPAGWRATVLWAWLEAHAEALARVEVVERWRGRRSTRLRARLATAMRRIEGWD